MLESDLETNEDGVALSYEGVLKLSKDSIRKTAFGTTIDWLTVAKACYDWVMEGNSPEFAGSWILKYMKHKGYHPSWFPGLRRLAAYGILERIEVSRGGKRAYWRFVDFDGTSRALQELGRL